MPIQPLPPAKPTQCQLPVPDDLSTLPPEFSKLAAQRIQAEIDFYKHYAEWTEGQRNQVLQAILDLDNQMAQMMVADKIADGVRYQTAVAELRDCQEFVKSLP